MAILNSAIKREDTKDQVYTLDFFCDWGCAREYMEMAMALLHAKAPKDVIFATGKTWYGRDFVRELFALYGLDYRDYLSEALPELDSVHFHVDIAETSAHLGRVPVRDIFDICHDFISPPGFLGGLSPHSLITEQEL
jgi:GDP-D-mannose dehydratase